MGLTMWMCVLCLQASLLSHALDCSGAQGERCGSALLADGQYDDVKQQRTLPLASATRKQTPLMVRRRRQLERRGPTHLSYPGLPGAISVKGFPNTLIQQADRARRHLAQVGSKNRKNKRKSRVGSFSLLSNNTPSAPLKVTRARRQLKNEPSKRGKAGAYSVLSDPDAPSEGQNRPKRSAQKKRAARRNVCS